MRRETVGAIYQVGERRYTVDIYRNRGSHLLLTLEGGPTVGYTASFDSGLSV